MSPTPTLITIYISPYQKSNPYCPYDSIFITGIISLIVVSLILFFILMAVRKLLHLNFSKKRLLIYTTGIIMILSIIKNYFFYYPHIPLFPFPFWLTPIDCM
ncbi:hypothetical protein COV53_06000 [Candidatus Gottesmanbacteria bacterium CG11_big_fil_rev_8_21_14_0_20_37_11]|uniref:Uncharacterized protein n=3 Tax=Candidatus Gottesmaniibacteriota TaxID=1752720 RepID=A0A2M7RRZ4_9BACT|nr:MAG: hypothetical protein AUJ73_02315 [Candidatus Gottesmanbacteria bacterium CG1_02_37_22]PIP32391.1 MAG: hypothetical protein COX23_04940 [Candidatus Gottesmanbacteria bacterium CG23_combo_of_CG06-09_8_20_14_all_37_19]PIR07853.1 MAG: hypothetical protein COV53_06000 [Candidatus Gottesmanbacteria bacterium CG11_big_fil_rev_8_21_14_0_20_37_11]PIZ03036.1 MAG: hypothetical protein COY59_01560 [Candidatus Gottesmanbacteria bacterium CG_4_10_14_0_8_um_filter_37_24]